MKSNIKKGKITLPSKPITKNKVSGNINPIPSIIDSENYTLKDTNNWIRDNAGYSSLGVKYMFVELIKKNIISPLQQPVACREDLIRQLRRHLTDIPKFRTFDDKVLRLGIIVDHGSDNNNEFIKDYPARIKSGVRLANFVSVKYGFKPTVVHSTNDSKIFIVEGDNKWLLSSHYLSLYTLMLRVGNLGCPINRYKSMAGLRKKFINIDEKINNDNAPGLTSDMMHIRNTFDYWAILLEYQKEFLECTDNLYSLDRLENDDNGYHEGISAIVTGESCDSELRVRLQCLMTKKEIINKKWLKW